MLIKAFLIALFLVPSLSQGASPPDFTLQVTQLKRNPPVTQVIADAPAKHHFNLKAPAFLLPEGLKDAKDRILPKTKAEDRVVFELKSAVPFSATLYLCDDKNTYCIRRVVGWDGSAQKSLSPAPHSGGLPPGETSPKPVSGENSGHPTGRIDAHGFLNDQPELAMEKAKKEGKLLMIEFHGIWCPACNQLEARVFSTPEFARQTSDFVKLKMDGDAATSWALKSRYGIRFYPTTIFATPAGDEISRVVGFKPLPSFLASAQEAKTSKKESVRSLKRLAEKGNREAMDTLGRYHLSRGEFSLAVRYLTGTKAFQESYYDAQIGLLEQRLSGDEKSSKIRSELISHYEAAIQLFPGTPDSITRRLALAELYSEAKVQEPRQKLLRDAIQTAQAFIKSPELLKDADYSDSDILSLVASSHKALGDAKSAKKAYREAAKAIKTRKPTAQDRGDMLELAYYLWNSEDYPAAEKIYAEMEKTYQGEFTFYYAHARMKSAQGDTKRATELARLAFDHSYGDNRFKVLKLYAKLLRDSGQAIEALKLVREVLADSKVPSQTKLRTYAWIEGTRELEKELAKDVAQAK